MEDHIDITGADPIVLVKKAYELSKPQGLGFIHAREGGLSDRDAHEIVKRGIRMDYLHGRAVKLSVVLRDGRMLIPKRWYDHTDADLRALLSAIGKDQPDPAPVAAVEPAPANEPFLVILMPDGSKWGVPVAVIARNRAAAYAHEHGGDIERSLEEDTNPLFAEDHFEVHDWAANNMNWKDVSTEHAVRISEALPVDYQDGWTNGDYEVMSLPSVLKQRRC